MSLHRTVFKGENKKLSLDTVHSFQLELCKLGIDICLGNSIFVSSCGFKMVKRQGDDFLREVEFD